MNIFLLILLSIPLQDSSNVRLIGWWPYSNSNTVISNGNYTYLGSGFGIYVLNTSNPNSPLLINQKPTSGKIERLFINGNYLYCANGVKGLKIFDIANPENPIPIGELQLDGNAQDVFVKDSFAYVGTSDSTNALWIINIANPYQPILRGIYSYSGYWGCNGVEVKDTFAYITANTLKILNVANPSAPQLIDLIPVISFLASDVEINDTMLYFTEDGPTNYLRIANISDPTNPIICSNKPFPQAITHIDIKDSLCYIAHYIGFYIINVANPYNPYTIGEIYQCGGSDVSVFDTIAYLTGDKLRPINIANPQNPYILSTFFLPGGIKNISVCDSIAYLAMNWNGLWIIDIQNPTNPSELGRWIYNTKDIFVKNNLAYTVGDSGLAIVDISNPELPLLIGNLLLPAQAWALALSDSICYIADGYGGLRIIDISDSTNPVELGYYPSSSHTWDVVVRPGIAYIADHDAGLKIIDVSNPSSPVLLSQLPYSGYQTKVVDGITDTICVVTNSSYGYLRIIDAHNPLSPVEIGSFYSPEPILGLKVSSPYVYITTSAKLSVIDVSNTGSPFEAGYYDLPTYGYCCFTYDNHILVGTSNAGLMLFDYFGPGIAEQETGDFPKKLILNNPVQNELLVKYEGKKEGWLNIKIYDIGGRLFFKANERLIANSYFKRIFLKDFSAGVYFLLLETEEDRCIEKFILLK